MTVPASATQQYSPAGPSRGTEELCVLAELDEEARALATGPAGAPPPRAFIDLLIERELHLDAIRFLAHALPRRESVWWAWVCARKSAGEKPEPKIKAAIDATERWVVQPTEENRRNALYFGEAADFGTAAGCAALAAFMSSGSLAPPNAPVVPPGEFMTAKAVSGSVTLAAVGQDPKTAKDRFVEFIRLGLEVAERTKLWPK